MSRIVYTCPYVPAEWIAAHELTPSRIQPPGNLELFHSKLGEGICHYMHGFVTEASKAHADAVIFTTVCDQMRRAPECMDEDAAFPIFLMNIPASWQSIESYRLYISELRRLGTFLSEIGGTAPTRERLLELMRIYDDKRKALLEARSEMMPKAFSQSLIRFHRTGDIHVEKNKGARPRGTPIALIGGPLTRMDLTLFDVIQEAGGYVALDGTETGERTLPGRFRRQETARDPFMELADAYFGTIPDAFRRPNSALYRWIQKEINGRDIEGIVFIRNVWCDLWHAELHRMRDWLQVPLLDIDLNGDDPVIRNATRIQAFMEILR